MSTVTIFRAELLKLKRAPIVWVLGVVYCLAPLMLGLMMSVLKDPALGKRLGLITTKAQLTIGAADWPTYLMLSGMLFAGGMMVLSIVNAFVFGREYVEGTAKNLLALPVRRSSVVGAKLLVSGVWFLAMAVVVYLEALILGFAIGLPGYSAPLLRSSLSTVARTVLFVYLAGPASGWITVASRGYLAPVGGGVLLLLIGDLFAHTGWAQWVPWSIILVSAQGKEAPGTGSILVLVGLFLAGAYATYLTLDRSDNTQ